MRDIARSAEREAVSLALHYSLGFMVGAKSSMEQDGNDTEYLNPMIEAVTVAIGIIDGTEVPNGN